MTFRVENAIRSSELQIASRWEEMLAFGREWISSEPNNFLAWQSIGDALQGLKRYSEAIENYKQGLKYAPESAPVEIDRAFTAAPLWHRMGHAYTKLAKTSESIFAFQKAVLVDEYSSELWNDLGVAHMQSSAKDIMRAFDAFKMAVARDPKNIQAIKNLGVIYAMVNKDEGITSIRNMLRNIDRGEVAVFDELVQNIRSARARR
jgi:tetratricopeptide (TPR) repeat protein